jgi:predicted O-methyltransferase YrrM
MENYYQDIHGWFCLSDKEIYNLALNTYESGSIFVEIGSFKGRSSVAMAVDILNSNKDIKFYCIDTWDGSAEHQAGQWCEDKDVVNGSLYNVFLKNIEPVKNFIIPIRKTSVEASHDFTDNSISFLFLDASHDYESVKNDLGVWKSKIKQGGILSGHDWSWESVQKAVNDFCSENSLTVDIMDNVWKINL